MVSYHIMKIFPILLWKRANINQSWKRRPKRNRQKKKGLQRLKKKKQKENNLREKDRLLEKLKRIIDMMPKTLQTI